MNSSGSTFTTDKIFLLDLLRSIHTGEVQLPDFQRGWIWDDEHVRELIESVSLGYPIGTVMLLEATDASVRFKPRAVDGAPSVDRQPIYLILDGQQRLTSLYQALYAQHVVQTRDARKKPMQRWYCMTMPLAIQENADRSDAILSLPQDRQVKNFRGELEKDYSSPELEYQGSVFPLNQVFDSAEWRRGYNHLWSHERAKGDLFDRFERSVIDRIKAYQVPVIIMRHETPKEAVCQVFEKVNTGGVSLTVFELLTASFAAEDYQLRQDWEQREQRLRTRPVLEGLQNTDFLQTVALLSTYEKRLEAESEGGSPDTWPGISCKRREILRLTVNEYQSWADRVERGFWDASRFLRRQYVYTARDLSYRTQVVPLAAIFAWLGDEAESDGIHNKLAQWFWCGVMGELYGSAVESRFARDLPEMVAWLRETGEMPRTIDDANFVPTRLYTLRTRNSAAYKGIHALLMREGCLDFRTGTPVEEQTYFDDRIDIHHVFPKAWCDRHGIPANRYDCVINKAPLSARTNRIVGGNAPSEYLEVIQRSAGIDSSRLDAILRTHAIDPRTLRYNDFDAFFVHREAVLLGLIERAMGKSIIRDATNNESVPEEDYEGMLEDVGT